VTATVKRLAAAPVVPDAELLARLSEGDLDALGQLYDRWERDVRRFVQRLGVRPHDADDIVQLTFLDLAKSAVRYDGRSAARAWILGVAAIVVRRHRRSIARLFQGVAGAVFESRRPAPRQPDEAFTAEEEQHRFRDALEKLSPKKREVFVLVTMEGASGEEAAAALGIPVATVWTRLHHARKELREMLGGES
jgi:RNA polymerase sigma-70 factor (ECF subfamily)